MTPSETSKSNASSRCEKAKELQGFIQLPVLKVVRLTMSYNITQAKQNTLGHDTHSAHSGVKVTIGRGKCFIKERVPICRKIKNQANLGFARWLSR